MPPYVSLHDVESWELPVYAGKAHAPFRVHRGAKDNQALANMPLPSGVSRQRLEGRKGW